MSHLTRPALLAACFAALLSASPANAAPPAADAGLSTALEALNRTPQADPDVFNDQVAAVLKTRHETAKNSVGNIR